MLNQITYKKRFTYLLIVAMLFVFLVYKMAIRRSIEAIKELDIAEKQLEGLAEAPAEIRRLNLKLNSLNNSVSILFDNSRPIQEVMLDQIASYCNQNHILIKQFPKAEIIEKEDYTLETNYVVLEGSYQKLLILLFNMEQKYKLGKVSSARFFKSINTKTKRTELNLEIFIQKIRTHEKR